MTNSPLYPTALFAGLVFDEADQPVRTALVGASAHYIVDDDGFERFIEAEPVDRAVLAWMKTQMQANRAAVTQGVLQFLGKDDLFTKAMIDSSLNNMDHMAIQPLPQETRAWLGMLGFRVVINLHGELVRVDMPAAPDHDGE